MLNVACRFPLTMCLLVKCSWQAYILKNRRRLRLIDGDVSLVHSLEVASCAYCLACRLARRQRQPRRQEWAAGGPTTFAVGGRLSQTILGRPFLKGYIVTLFSAKIKFVRYIHSYSCLIALVWYIVDSCYGISAKGREILFT